MAKRHNFQNTAHILLLIATFYLAILVGFVGRNNDEMYVIASNHSDSKIRHDKAIVVNGQPIFPLGFYYVDYDVPESDYSKRNKAIKDMSAAGFNVISLSINNNLNAYVNLLDEAEKLKFYVMNGHEADAFDITKTLNTLKNKPALLSWNIADDVSNRKKPNQVVDSRQEVKNGDPNHLTYISMFDPRTEVIKRYLHTSDLVGMQSYPISNRPIKSTFSEIKAVVHTSQQENGGPVIANLQAFRWTEPDDSGKPQRQPTFAEVRNMTYQALLAGAKGILYYTYRDNGWYLPDHPDLWQGLKSLTPEIKKLSQMLLDGNLQQMKTGAEDIFAGVWVYQDQAVAVVINTSDTQATQVAIALPNGMSDPKPMFVNRPSGMVVKGGVLCGLLKPLEVDVYSLKGDG